MLSRRVAELERRAILSDFQRRQAEAAPAPSANGSTPEPYRSAADLTEQEQQASSRKRAMLDEMHAAEPVDEEWAPAFERSLRETLQGEAFAGTTTVAISCRYTHCRAELNHATEDAMDRFGDQLAFNMPKASEAWGTRIHDERGGFRSLVYFAREGHPMLRKMDGER